MVGKRLNQHRCFIEVVQCDRDVLYKVVACDIGTADLQGIAAVTVRVIFAFKVFSVPNTQIALRVNAEFGCICALQYGVECHRPVDIAGLQATDQGVGCVVFGQVESCRGKSGGGGVQREVEGLRAADVARFVSPSNFDGVVAFVSRCCVGSVPVTEGIAGFLYAVLQQSALFGVGRQGERTQVGDAV